MAKSPASAPSTPASVPPSLSSQPNASSDSPASSPPTPPASPPLSAPPPSVPPPAVPASPPPTSPPLPSASSPPPDSTNAPPPVVSSPPTSPALPPTSTPSPPSQPLSPPPSSPPPPPPVTVSPPPPDNARSPPPPNNTHSPPPAPAATPPSSPSQPPPSAASPPLPSTPPPSSTPAPPSDPSAASPPPSPSPPSRTPAPPSDTSAPPPKNAAPASPSPPSLPPSNVVTPSVPSPPQDLLSPAPPSVDPNKPPDASQNATAGPRDRPFNGGSGIKTGAIVPIVLVAGLFMLSLLGFAVWYTRKRRRRVGRYNAGFVMPSPYSSSQYSETSYSRSPMAPLAYNSSGAGSHGFMNSPGMGNPKSSFTYAELHKITDGFSSKNLLGEGGFGCVYKGCFADGREVAVKQLKVGGGQGEREFAAEVEIISRVHHRHLVSLVGYCIADKQRLLVYDFVRNDTLDYHLHAQGGTVLDWATRVKIAAGAARGIAYLHEDCHPRIIHRDIKSSNILLDGNFEAQVSDFGLARLALDADTHITTRVMGTFGYLAPEYASSGKLTDRSDVFSFGVVLLELITGRKPVDQTQPLGEESLVEWARPLMTQALDSADFGVLPDARLENNYNEKEMFRMIETAAACVRHSAAMRPKMGLVVRALDTLTETDINNGVIPGQSELFAAPQSAEVRMFQRMAFGNQNFSDGFTRSSWMSRTESETASDVL